MKKERLKQACLDLYNGEPITNAEIARYLHTSIETIRKYLKDYNLYNELPDIFTRIHKPLKQFDSISLQSAYWIGYLLADGCVAYKNSKTKQHPRLMLECKTEDIEILQKFCDFLEIRYNRITQGHQGKSVALSIAISNFSTSPVIYGIVPLKSYQEHNIPEAIAKDESLFFQYLKGIIDGDGTIHTSKASLGVSFVSNSKTLMEEVKHYLQKYLPYPNSVWIMTAPTTSKTTQPLYHLKIGTGHQRKNLIYLFNQFNNTPIICSRKYDKLKKIIGSL